MGEIFALWAPEANLPSISRRLAAGGQSIDVSVVDTAQPVVLHANSSKSQQCAWLVDPPACQPAACIRPVTVLLIEYHCCRSDFSGPTGDEENDSFQCCALCRVFASSRSGSWNHESCKVTMPMRSKSMLSALDKIGVVLIQLSAFGSSQSPRWTQSVSLYGIILTTVLEAQSGSIGYHVGDRLSNFMS